MGGFDVGLRFVIVVVGSFWPLNQSLSTNAQHPFKLPLPSLPFLNPMMALQGFFIDPNNQPTKQNQFNFQRLWVVFAKFWSDNQFWRWLLKYPGLFLLGGELTLIFFLFLVEEIATKSKDVFQRFEENGLIEPDLGPPSRIFAPTSFKKTAIESRATSAPANWQNSQPKKHLHKLPSKSGQNTSKTHFWGKIRVGLI